MTFDLMSTLTIVGVTLVPTLSLVYMVLRNQKLDDKKKYDELKGSVNLLKISDTQHTESFKRVDLQISNLKAQQARTEANVAERLDRMESKVDKIVELLIENKRGG